MLFYPLGRPITLGVLSYVYLLIPLCLLIRAKLSKVWGFPLFARVSKGLGVFQCFVFAISNALFAANA